MAAVFTVVVTMAAATTADSRRSLLSSNGSRRRTEVRRLHFAPRFSRVAIWRAFVLVLQAKFVPIVRSKKGTRDCASRSIPLRARGF
jgi:hypothetical protein